MLIALKWLYSKLALIFCRLKYKSSIIKKSQTLVSSSILNNIGTAVYLLS